MTTQPDDRETGAEEAAEREPAGGETMEALLAQQETMAKRLSGHQVAWVKVIQVTAESVLVDVGEKKEGVVPLSDFASPDEAPAAGQRIPVVRAGSRKDGAALLSHRKARASLGWEAAVKAFGEKARVRGQVRSAIKGGFLVDVGGVTGFLPASLADLHPVREPQKMVGTGVRCYVIEVNESKKQVVLSRKAVLQEEAGKRKVKLLGELKVGQVRVGRVVQSGPAGLVVDIGGAEGFVKASDASWGKPKPPSEKRGDKVRVKILSVPASPDERLGLGIKQLLANPADSLRKRFPPKAVVKGTVAEAGPAGVRITLEGGQAAFSPSSECDAEAGYKAGDAVSAIVQGIHAETLDVTVSLRRFEEMRDRKRMAQYLKAPKPLTLGEVLSPETREE